MQAKAKQLSECPAHFPLTESSSDASRNSKLEHTACSRFLGRNHDKLEQSLQEQNALVEILAKFRTQGKQTSRNQIQYTTYENC